jgi:hypothetical protein
MNSRRLYLGGSISALYFLLALAVQQVVLAVAGDTGGGDAELQSRLSNAQIFRALLLWIGFWGLAVAFHALYVRTSSQHRYWARVGLATSLVFVGCELSYRTIDVFVVTLRWTAAWAVATGDARAELAKRIALWDEVVGGWYVFLITAHLIGAVAFAAAVGRRGRWPDRALFATLVGYAVLLAMRLGAYLVPALGLLSNDIFFPVVGAHLLALAVALLSARREAARPISSAPA